MLRRTTGGGRGVAAGMLAFALAGCSGPEASDPPAASEVSSTPTVDEAPSSAGTPSSGEAPSATQDLVLDLSALEEEFDATVGVSAIDTATGRRAEHRATERFGFASTIKLFAAAVMLRELDKTERAERLTWTVHDVSEAGYAPVTAQHVSDGLTVLELAEATVRESDNLALNLVIQQIGGLEALGAGLVALGDTTTRVTELEPRLNEPDLDTGDSTTTPAALTQTLARILQPGTLDPADLDLLLEWTSDNPTGDTLVRAGAPEGWTVRDKSGGAGPMRNDVAIVTPPGGAPVILTILTRKNDPSERWDDELVARAAAEVLKTLP